MAPIYRRYRRNPRKQQAWDISNPGNVAIRRELTDRLTTSLREAPEGPILDAGCGSGWWLRHLWTEGIPAERLHGLEILPERVQKARAAVPGAHIEQGDVMRVDYAPESFAAVFLVTVLSSLGSRQAASMAISELWRVVTPGGVLVIWEARVPNPTNPATRVIRAREVESATGVACRHASLTVFPPLARRLGQNAGRWYPRLARIPLLRTHRMYVCRRPVPGARA